jgi:hypothetical protein
VTTPGNPPRFWDDPARRASVIYERKGSAKLIPAILRVPLHVKSKADHDPEYLSRGGRGSKKARRQEVMLRDYRAACAADPVFADEWGL